MKPNTRAHLGIFLSMCCAHAIAQTSLAPGVTASPLADEVSRLEEDFLSKVESASELRVIFDEYEARLTRLMHEYQGQPEPFVALTELFEKCEQTRTLRILDECLGRAELPEKIRLAYQSLRRTAGLVGTPVDLSLIAVDGRVIRFKEFPGKVVIIDFWATWCAPCVRDLPKLQALHARHQGDGLEVIGVSFDRERSKLDSFLRERKIPWTQIHPTIEERETIARSLGVSGGYLPTVFIVGRDGRLRHTLNSRFRLEEKIAVLLKEK